MTHFTAVHTNMETCIHLHCVMCVWMWKCVNPSPHWGPLMVVSV